MRDAIMSRLSSLEKSENICIIHAIESGSRAWGFASTDSDYDVRFIYVRNRDFYLRLDKTRDVIELPLDDILDINGWDLQKALRLLHTSNPTLFEWNNSPIVYKTTDTWLRIQKEVDNYFLAKSGLYHYLSTAKSNYREYIKGETVTLKKYFYVIRPILACKWILAKNCPPPMLFTELVNSQLDSYMLPVIGDLLERKRSSPEIKQGPRIESLNLWIERNLVELKERIDNLPKDVKSDWSALNQMFMSAISEEVIR